jgi:hypothetical protein
VVHCIRLSTVHLLQQLQLTALARAHDWTVGESQTALFTEMLMGGSNEIGIRTPNPTA